MVAVKALGADSDVSSVCAVGGGSFYFFTPMLAVSSVPRFFLS
jgi:hypothetical protein